MSLRCVEDVFDFRAFILVHDFLCSQKSAWRLEPPMLARQQIRESQVDQVEYITLATLHHGC